MSNASYIPRQRVLGQNSLVTRLNFERAAKYVTGGQLTDLPRLVSDMALENASEDLAKQTAQELRVGLIPSFEFVPMPKPGYGNRPLAVLSPQTRVVLEALVGLLEESLLVSSRLNGYHAFEAFGTELDNSWLVDFDIAACYEFIDHNVLAAELILQGADAEVVDTLRRILNSLLGREIGLPQGVNSSHRLADTYLDQIERNLARRGYEIKRYADDFRVIANSRKDAFQIIEAAMDEARRVHLALAEQKIHVNKAEDLAAQIQKRSTTLDQYTKRVYGELSEKIFVKVGYDEVDIEYIEPDPSDVDLAAVNFAAISGLLSDWADLDKPRDRAMAHAGTIALSSARQLKERLPNDVLARIIDKEPIRLRKVMEYVLARTEETANWELLNVISELERSTPWHKIWLLSTATSLADDGSNDEEDFAEFAVSLLDDSHETVRLEAAWFLALKDHAVMKSGQLPRLYSEASSISRIGLAAVAGRLSRTSEGSEAKAIKGDGVLNNRAFEWGKSVE